MSTRQTSRSFSARGDRAEYTNRKAVSGTAYGASFPGPAGNSRFLGAPAPQPSRYYLGPITGSLRVQITEDLTMRLDKTMTITSVSVLAAASMALMLVSSARADVVSAWYDDPSHFHYEISQMPDFDQDGGSSTIRCTATA